MLLSIFIIPGMHKYSGCVASGGNNPFTLAYFEYLKRYYNLKKEPFGRRKRSWPSFTSKVKDMQAFFGLNTTGAVDSETLEVMLSPRCGVPDVEEYSHNLGTRWNKNVITYSIGRYTRDLPRGTVDSLVESALSVWARASSLTFVRSPTRNADIMVEFVSYAHGDLYPFDGPRGTLAHAFGPGEGTGGDTHFDDDEHWTTGGNGFNLYLVAAHEFGHALGLKHSRNPESLMYPTYKYPRTLSLLSREDVANINTLYGKQFLCFFLCFFLSCLLACSLSKCLLMCVTVGPLRGRPITNFMPKIESSIDAAFWVPRRSTAYLIHGKSMYWTVKGSLVKGKPKPLTNFGFPVWVQDIDAAVHIVKTGRTLFFIHDIYWSYNENRRIMDIGYPKLISEDFPGLNTTISAAIHKEGFIYFFIGPQVYKYDYTHKHIVGAEKANTWLGC
uniref:Matrix metallopeptidase 20b (enamelysin) n=1 Tax=Myripristis murdjan TaxID=586833 RepID=A0A667WV21_9TELE